ncbi:cytochrome c maturation protein CcmE [Adlercreutzia sp. ZJ473]|uniref:cytochrome c maturation protein CcmE domain-containing protein n=1 Tax=Adlercreutzia sp. ZJ473 TaxID=2722822 RepID=UPI001555A6B7
MNAKMKKRLVAVSGIVVIVLIVLLAVVGGGTAAKTVTVAEAVESTPAGQKVQVSGNVVENSFVTEHDVLTFKIYDPAGSPATQLPVRYEGAASSTFGNDVTAICTGKIGDDGVLACSELVTKCPSKYENADAALTVARMLEYGDEITGTVVKVAGTVGAGSLQAAGLGDRFTLVDADGAAAGTVSVLFEGALSDEVTEGASVVLTGSMNEDGKFAASDVALEG